MTARTGRHHAYMHIVTSHYERGDDGHPVLVVDRWAMSCLDCAIRIEADECDADDLERLTALHRAKKIEGTPA